MIVDVAFSIAGRTIPLDHGYQLYGALCAVKPTLHGVRWFGVHPVTGSPDGAGMLLLRRESALRLRLPAERIPDVLDLVGRSLSVAGYPLLVGTPRICPLAPAASLDARLVVIKLTDAPRKPGVGGAGPSLDVVGFAARYEAEITRQLTRLEIRRPFSLTGRRSVTVGGRRVVGYSVRVRELAADESLRLQAEGIGGKRCMGCGIFRESRVRE